MSEDRKCELTGRRCWRQDCQEEPCAGSPTLEDAARCIEALDGHNEELHHELDAMERWVEKLLSKTKEPQDEKTSITPH